MPTLSNPALLLSLCLIIGLVIGVNATLLSVFRRGPNKNEGRAWSRVFRGAQDRQRQQAADLDALHQAVNNLAANPSNPNKPNE